MMGAGGFEFDRHQTKPRVPRTKTNNAKHVSMSKSDYPHDNIPPPCNATYQYFPELLPSSEIPINPGVAKINTYQVVHTLVINKNERINSMISCFSQAARSAGAVVVPKRRLG